MRVAILEVCRRPELPKKNTEAKVLSTCFKQLGIDFDLFSNDNHWANRPKAGVTVDRDIIAANLIDPQIDVVHFAVHGGPTGLVLKWSGPIEHREVTDTLTGNEIRQMGVSSDKLVVSGACASSSLANDFIFAGVKAYISPKHEIPWTHLGSMFQIFYSVLQFGAKTADALAQAMDKYPELASYEVHAHVKD